MSEVENVLDFNEDGMLDKKEQEKPLCSGIEQAVHNTYDDFYKNFVEKYPHEKSILTNKDKTILRFQLRLVEPNGEVEYVQLKIDKESNTITWFDFSGDGKLILGTYKFQEGPKDQIDLFVNHKLHESYSL